MRKVKVAWLEIDGYGGRFKISNNGDVKSLERKVKRRSNSFRLQKEMIKKKRVTSFGYETVLLSINKKYKHYFVHVLVAKHFISPKPSPNHQVNHVDGNKLNNHVSNLEWVTPGENRKHGFRLGLINQDGEKHPSAKLNNKNVIHILTSKGSSGSLSKKFGVTVSTINRIRAKKSWVHISNTLK